MGQEPRNPRAALRSLTWVVVLPLVLGFASTAQAQMRLVSAKRGNGSPPPPPAYVDRVIEELASDAAEESRDEVSYSREGWPRFLRLETRLGTQPYGERDRSVGFTASGAIETPNHGTLSIDANVATDERRDAVTLRQLGLPVDGGWQVNNEIGVITPVAPPVMRQPSRVFVPTDFVRGASTQWSNPASRTQWQASTGQVGRLLGYPVSGFDTLHGEVSTIAVQGSAAEWTAAVRHARAGGVSRFDDPRGADDFIDSTSTHVAVRRESGAYSVQANAIASRSTETSDTRNGAWVDGEWKRGTSIYSGGFFRMDPDLSWAGQGMSSDVEGAYARGSWRARRWSADGGIDALRTVSGDDDTGLLVTASGRWRYSRTLTLGAGGSVRNYRGNAGTAYTDLRLQNEWGLTGVRAEFASGFGRQSRKLVADHSWQLPQGWALSTSLAAGRESGEEAAGSLWGAAVSIAAPLGNDATFTGNASTERRGDGSRTSSANVSLAWRLSQNWSVEGNFIYSQGRQNQVVSIDPLAPPPERLLIASDTRSLFLVLRYETRAGTRMAPLGGTPQTGGGSIEGVVFLDANRSGTQEAGEAGAAGATVYLDGRYAVRTDSQGRFSFPFVAPGPRVITLLNETLPLPWEAGDSAQTRIEVVVREAARVVIPAVRRGGD